MVPHIQGILRFQLTACHTENDGSRIHLEKYDDDDHHHHHHQMFVRALNSITADQYDSPDGRITMDFFADREAH